MSRHTLFHTIWYFIWKDDSVLSWIVNVILAFLIVKFLVFPGLGLLLGTDLPLVAVVSGSMEHDGSLSEWWSSHGDFYSPYHLLIEHFESFRFSHGFNKGDIMILVGPDNLAVGDVIVFQGSASDPIIHRIIQINKDGTYRTKGDANSGVRPDEESITSDRIIGKAVFRVLYLGWFKILFG